MHGGAVPILIGGGGERVTLRLVARYADRWNGCGPLETSARKNRILDDCARVDALEFDRLEDYVAAGATHFICGAEAPFAFADLGAPRRLARRAGAVNAPGGPADRARDLFVGPYLDQRSPDVVLAHEPPDLARSGS